jgi:hypothetical protein
MNDKRLRSNKETKPMKSRGLQNLLTKDENIPYDPS